MRARRPLLVVGLTGGIASGKSVVCRMLQDLGVAVIDADTIVHALSAPGGKAAAPILAAFGPGVGASGGGVDRAALGAIVFRDPAARAKLEGIVHPLVLEEIARRINELRDGDGPEIVVVDAALLVESGLHRRFDRLVVVSCSQERQLERLIGTRGLDREEALRRVRAQATSEEKAAAGDYVIDNDGPLEATRAQVDALHRSLREDLEAMRSGALTGRWPS